MSLGDTLGKWKNNHLTKCFNFPCENFFLSSHSSSSAAVRGLYGHPMAPDQGTDVALLQHKPKPAWSPKTASVHSSCSQLLAFGPEQLPRLLFRSWARSCSHQPLLLQRSHSCCVLPTLPGCLQHCVLAVPHLKAVQDLAHYNHTTGGQQLKHKACSSLGQ